MHPIYTQTLWFYADIFSSIEYRAEYSQINASPAEKVAAKLYARLTARNPGPVVRVAKDSVKIPLYKAVLPLAVADSIMKKMFKLNGLAGR